ncbi:unnamed protein product [Callosobruchus maculatus]|uniref:Uncharacterized protein n=1 Tax=Callosobruchus maculatus TaxID=64391 RepID=A0A653C7J0_CALMS|nr:unnamed protein product [Callosobruchus maculatus]
MRPTRISIKEPRYTKFLTTSQRPTDFISHDYRALYLRS